MHIKLVFKTCIFDGYNKQKLAVNSTKLENLEKLDIELTMKQLSMEYNVGDNTVHDIHKNKEKLNIVFNRFKFFQ